MRLLDVFICRTQNTKIYARKQLHYGVQAMLQDIVVSCRHCWGPMGRLGGARHACRVDTATIYGHCCVATAVTTSAVGRYSWPMPECQIYVVWWPVWQKIPPACSSTHGVSPYPHRKHASVWRESLHTLTSYDDKVTVVDFHYRLQHRCVECFYWNCGISTR